MPITYDQRPPSAQLAPFIECYWALVGDASPDPAEPERVLPDGRVEIVLNCGGPVWQTLDGVVRRQPHTIVVGATTRPVYIAPTDTLRMLGIRFRHGGAHALLGVPIVVIADTITSLDDVGRVFPSSIREEIVDAVDFDAQVRIVERHLLHRLSDRSAHDVASAVAVRLILASGGAMDVARVAAQAGVSTRQLARRFHQEVGVGPKVLARLARFHSLLRIVTTRRPSTLARAAAQAGYADQSHLVRDFRDFAQQTPSQYFKEANLLSAYFLELESPRSSNRDE